MCLTAETRRPAGRRRLRLLAGVLLSGVRLKLEADPRLVSYYPRVVTYSVNNVTAIPNDDGSVTIHFRRLWRRSAELPADHG